MTPSRVLWTPSAQEQESSLLTEFARRVTAGRGVQFGDYEALWRWSVEHVEDFWAEVWKFFDIGPECDTVLADRRMPGAVWFPGARLNYTGQVLRHATGRGAEPALIAVAEDGTAVTTTWDELGAQVGAVAKSLRRLGVRPGERVVGYLPNVRQAVVAFLATASIGAVWSTCGPEIGARNAVSRFGQLDPVLLIAADGYRFGGRTIDRRETVAEIAAAMPSLREVVHVPVAGLPVAGRQWAELLAEPAAPEPVPVPFDHPLWIVYSSGTTGRPKALVHGHGGILLTALVQAGLHMDMGPDDRVMAYTSTTWIMWNATVNSLLSGTTAVLYDGNPMYPGTDRLWRLAAEHRLGTLGVSPGYLRKCEKAGLSPARDHDLSALRSLGATGAPVPPGTYRWVAEQVGVPLNASCGGTEFAAAITGSAPWRPVYEGEMACRLLGCHVEAWDDAGNPVVDQVGELVIRTPMPSMPLRIWGDDDGKRFRETYFDTYPGVWRHGDWVTITSRGTAVVHGRSDATLNRNGIRMGSADIYQVVEALPEVTEALVLGIEEPDGGYWLPLFVRLSDGIVLDDELVEQIRAAIRTQLSPRHVPDLVVQTPAVPHSSTGKKLEVPLKRIFQGVAAADACDLGAVDDPAAVEWFAELARQRFTPVRHT